MEQLASEQPLPDAAAEVDEVYQNAGQKGEPHDAEDVMIQSQPHDEHHQPLNTDSSHRTVLAVNFVADVGKQMLESSTSVSEVLVRLRHILPAVGIEGCSLDASMSSITVSYWHPNLPLPITVMRDMEITAPRLRRLTAAEALLDQLERGSMPLDAAYDQLRALQRSPRLHPQYARIAILISVMGWVIFLNGSTVMTILAALLATFIVFPLDSVVSRLRLPLVFSALLSAAAVAAVPNLLAAAGIKLQVGPAVVGALFIYLPGRAVVSSVIDGLANAPVSSLSRGYEALITASALAVGMLLGSRVGVGFGVAYQPSLDATPLGISVIGVTLGVLGVAVAWGMSRKQLLPAVAAAAVGWLIVYFGVRESWVPDWVLHLIASLLLGAAGAMVAAAQRTVASVYTGVTILPLVPGFTLYSGMLALAQGQTAAGVQVLGEAAVISAVIAVGVGTGIALGSNVMIAYRWMNPRVKR